MSKNQNYEKELEIIMQKFTALCYRNGIPCFITAAIENTVDGKTRYISDFVSPDKVKIDLNDDQISRHVAVCNGFHTKLPDEPIEMDF